MIVFRITHKKYSNTLFASGLAGRWNSHGNKVIYTAESVAISLLENMVRKQGVGFSNLFETMVIDIPGDIDQSTVLPADLNTMDKHWRDPKRIDKCCQPIGDTWYQKGKTAVLKVPSAIVEGFDYVLNTTHPDFSRVSLIGTTPFEPDERIEDLLRHYKAKR